ncbi:MAG TPA: hypothetical protein VKD25_06140 [Burkholderiales bacterium]|nr:hypothetical protein [Burkholderiales bacterium]
MADKLLIAISGQGANAARWRSGRIVETRSFPSNEAGQTGFKDFLTGFSNIPVYIVVDAIEEDYRFETLPHAFGRDRADMVNRKLRQHYRNTPYMSATLLGRDAGKRRDDRYLFSALTNPELINDWLQAVLARGLPVGGIYLLPMLSGTLVEKLGVKAPQLLLVFQRVGALRLTFFRDRQFRLSRLTRGEGGRAENRPRFFAEEISNTRLYLHALRTMTLDEPLTVLLLDRDDDLEEVAAAVRSENPSLDCVRIGRAEILSRLDIPDQLLNTPYAIALHLLGIRAPAGNLAPPSTTAGHKRYQARRGIYAGCGALAAAALLWTAINLSVMTALRWDTEDAARQTALLSTQYLEATRQFPQAPASAENLQKAVEIAQRLRESTHTPQRVMTLVGRALEANPTVVIREFGWKYGTANIEVEGGGVRELAAPAPAAPAQAGSARKESALIDGEIRPFRGDYRGAIATINGMAARIAQEPEVAEVQVVKLPLNVNPALSLSGNTTEAAEQQAGTAEFKLLVVMKPSR